MTMSQQEMVFVSVSQNQWVYIPPSNVPVFQNLVCVSLNGGIVFVTCYISTNSFRL